MAARNPLWGGGEVERDKQESQSSATEEEQVEGAPVAQSTEAEPEADYWFLHDPDGEADDWSKTNPKS